MIKTKIIFQKNNSGVAMLLVISAITILTATLYTLTNRMVITKVKTYNQQYKLQAKLNAESGLLLALAKLKIYKEGKNIIAKNKNLKDIIPEDMLLSIFTQPFVFPIPMPSEAGIIQRTAFEDFNKKILIEGGISVSISSISGFLNPNNLRSSFKVGNSVKQNDEDLSQAEQKSPQFYIEQELINTLEQRLEEKKETDENFDLIYGDPDPKLLIKELKYYVNYRDDFNDPEKGELESIYDNLTPKYGPFSSISELYLLEGWNDALVELIKDQLTIHEASIIPINTINDKELKILFPTITEEQSKEFFQSRDGYVAQMDDEEDIDPSPFQSVSEFKDLIVQKLLVIDEEEYNQRIKLFESAGLKIGVSGKLFKVISVGEYRETYYTLEAYIDLPIKPLPPPKKSKDKDEKASSENTDTNSEELAPLDNKNTKKEIPQTLLDPRVIEFKAG